MKRAVGKTIKVLALLGGSLILAALLLVAGMFYYAKHGKPELLAPRKGSDAALCRENLRLLGASKEMAVMDHAYGAGTVIPAKVLAEYLDEAPGAGACPAGGRHAANPVGTPPSCTLHGSY